MLLCDCITVANDIPHSLSSRYVVQAGDTLVSIAKKFGFSPWREIYSHPENAAFRLKRPNPDKIFVGDELVIPGRAPTATEIAALGLSGGGGGAILPRMPLSLRLHTSPMLNLTRSKSDQFATDCKHAGNVKIRLTLFWLSNCVHPETSTRELLAKAEELYSKHGIGLDILPSRTPTTQHTIQVSADPILPEQFNAVRLEAGNRFNDQKLPGKKQRLPIFFGEFKDPANGKTVLGVWPAYCFVSGVLTKDKATLAHEIVHASGITGHVEAVDFPKNILTGLSEDRSEFWKMQVQRVAGAYFCK